MPASSFQRQLAVTAPPERCWEVLTDVPQLVEWVSIVDQARELTHLERYTAVLMDRLGPFKLRAGLDIRVSEVNEPRALRVRAVGEDRQVSSRIGVDLGLTIVGEPARTVVVLDGSYEVVGRVATLGAGIIRTKAEKIIDEFVAAASQSLGPA